MDEISEDETPLLEEERERQQKKIKDLEEQVKKEVKAKADLKSELDKTRAQLESKKVLLFVKMFLILYFREPRRNGPVASRRMLPLYCPWQQDLVEPKDRWMIPRQISH